MSSYFQVKMKNVYLANEILLVLCANVGGLGSRTQVSSSSSLKLFQKGSSSSRKCFQVEITVDMESVGWIGRLIGSSVLNTGGLSGGNMTLRS